MAFIERKNSPGVRSRRSFLGTSFAAGFGGALLRRNVSEGMEIEELPPGVVPSNPRELLYPTPEPNSKNLIALSKKRLISSPVTRVSTLAPTPSSTRPELQILELSILDLASVSLSPSSISYSDSDLPVHSFPPSSPLVQVSLLSDSSLLRELPSIHLPQLVRLWLP